MGFHRRHIDNDQIIKIYNDGGIQRIREWYTRGVDALITETGLASQVGSILSDDEWMQLGTVHQDEEIIKTIQQHLGVENPNKVGFFVDADPGFIKWAKANKKYMPGGLSLGNISKYGLVLSVIRGGIGMYYGFSMDKGSSYSRHRKGTEERYGVLAKDYETRTVYQGWEGAPAAKVTRKNLIDAATRVYVLDLDSLRDKYNVKGLTNDRANSKRGATALKDAKSIKKENQARYDAILTDRAAMTDVDKAVKDSIELLNQHISDALKDGTMDKFGNLVIGKDPRGRSLKITDGANYIKNLLDDYQRYKDYERQQKEAEAEGRGADNYYTTEVKNYAKRIQDRAKAVKAKNYAW